MNFNSRKLRTFDGSGYDKGRPWIVQALWVFISETFLNKVWFPSKLRVSVLRLFGAEIGQRVLVRHGVRIHWPWKLVIGDDVWIGVDAWLLNLEQITIGSDVCISQGALLCTGSHDFRSSSFDFDNQPISIGSSAWIGTRATVLRGVTVGSNAVVGATALVTQDVPSNAMSLAPRGELRERGKSS